VVLHIKRLPTAVLKQHRMCCVCVCVWCQCESISREGTPANTADGRREPQDRSAHRDASVDDQQQPRRWHVWIVQRAAKTSTCSSTSSSCPCPCRCRRSTAVERRLIFCVGQTRTHRYVYIGVRHGENTAACAPLILTSTSASASWFLDSAAVSASRHFGLGLKVLASAWRFSVTYLRNSVRLNHSEVNEHRKSILLLQPRLFLQSQRAIFCAICY